MRGGRLLRGERSTTKNDRTAVWGTEHRKNLLHRWGRLRSAALYWLRRPQPQTRKLKLSYDRVRERWGQVRCAARQMSSSQPNRNAVALLLYYFGQGGWTSTGMLFTTIGSVGLKESCSARKAMRSRVASAFSACCAS